MTRFLTLLSLVALLAVPVRAADDWTTTTFDESPDAVYASAVRVLMLHHKVEAKDPVERIVRFHVGATTWSWGYNIGMVLEERPSGGTSATVAIEKSGGSAMSWGSGQKEVKKIWKWIAEDLRKRGR